MQHFFTRCVYIVFVWLEKCKQKNRKKNETESETQRYWRIGFQWIRRRKCFWLYHIHVQISTLHKGHLLFNFFLFCCPFTLNGWANSDVLRFREQDLWKFIIYLLLPLFSQAKYNSKKLNSSCRWTSSHYYGILEKDSGCKWTRIVGRE